MRKIFVLVTMLSLGLMAMAQQPIKVETYHLKNGLKVILCEEHSQPLVHGSVLVHAGSKNENPNATGVAHYFEHIMFKGTDRIGTTDWAHEKLYLDSISQAYDRLHATQDTKERHNIQLEINRLNIAASKYAIPNEVDAILQKMGCTGLNAGTSYDYTVYYNALPSNQLSNWMDVYVERFRNPIFRLFQSELEAVYEEKNMYENQMIYDFSRNIFREAFGEHPYSRDVIGLGEHLKNPQPSEMQKFFDTYYVANNMTLILVGDFKTSEAKKLIEDKFSVWRSAPIPQQPDYKLPVFDQQKVLNVKQTPIKMGLLTFPGVKNSHRDYLPLQMMGSILGGGSGLLDKAVSEGRLMMAQLMPLALEDAGANVVLFVPNLVGQNHEAAEKVIWDCIDSVKQGRFSDELMQSIKNSSLIGRQQSTEDIMNIAQLLQQLELEGSSYDEWLKENERWMQLTREEIMEVANKYFDKDHCTIVRSKMGFPSHDAAVKPDWDHLEAQNQGAQSAFAKAIASNQPEPIKPQIVDFNKDVSITDVTPNCKLYSTPNPKNDVFQLSIVYRYGTLDNPDLENAITYLDKLGANDMDRQAFNQMVDQFGGYMNFYCGENQSTILIGGLEQNMDTIVALATQWLFSPRHDAKQISLIVDELKSGEKAAKSSSDDWFKALRQFTYYGDRSSYLNHTSYKEWSKRNGEQLHNEVLQILTRNGHATFSGNTDPSDVAEMLRRNNLVRENVTVVGFREKQEQKLDKAQVVYANNKKFLQSDIVLYVQSGDFDRKDVAAAALYNEYFGGGMNSVVFQEIREFRSLGYSTYGRFTYDILNLNPASQFCFLGTQCDKTRDGVEALRDLIVEFPKREDKFGPAVEHQVVARNSNYITFRDLPNFVRTSIDYYGYDHDTRAEITEQISQLTLDDLQQFHNKYIKNRPIIAIISGNAKKFNPNEVAKLLGDQVMVKEVKYNQMFKF